MQYYMHYTSCVGEIIYMRGCMCVCMYVCMYMFVYMCVWAFHLYIDVDKNAIHYK